MMKRGNILLCNDINYTNWLPQEGPNSLLLSLSDYKEFHKISTTVHLHEHEAIQEQREIIPNQLSYQDFCHLSKSRNDLRVTWYHIHIPSEGNNFHGNVSYVLDIDNLMTTYQTKVNIYFVEVVDFKTRSASRILVTTKSYDNLQVYNPEIFGGPWYRDPSGYNYYLSNAHRLDRKTNKFGHRLEFMLEFEKEDREWLCKESQVVAVNHHEANSGKRRTCLKHGLHASCPYPFKKAKTEELMKSQQDIQQNSQVSVSQGEHSKSQARRRLF